MIGVESLFLRDEDLILQAFEVIQRGAVGIALVVDDKQRLVGTITDGDLRRAILDGISMDDKVRCLMEKRPDAHLVPTSAPHEIVDDELLRIMKEKSLRHIPLLDGQKRVVGLKLLDEFVDGSSLKLSAVVMAGGFGKRLRPLTENVPKPMLPLNGRPLMEHTIEQLRKGGIEQIVVTTHYKPEAISDHFQDGREFGVRMQYVNEHEPLGTAGSLRLIEKPTHTSLVINGDILTQLDFRTMLSFHRDHDADMTVGVRKYEFQVPYGVAEMDGVKITDFTEKPEHLHFINAGIYLLEPRVFDYIPQDDHFHMTDLINRLIGEKRSVIGFPIREYWLDIGRLDDYQQAVEDTENNNL